VYSDVCSVLQSTVYTDVYSRCVQCVRIHSICWCVQSMCAVCYNPQYMLMCTVDVCSVLQSTVYADVYSDVCSVLESTVYADVYSRCVYCVTIHSICWCVQSMCAVCYNPQYMLMCTVDVCSLLQSTAYADVYNRCVQCVTIHSICWCIFCLLSYHEMTPKHCQFSAIQKVTIM
jgi:hypothetical protein